MKLTTKCPDCEIKSKEQIHGWCDSCDGTREILTQEGHELFEFIKKYFVPRYELESKLKSLFDRVF